MKVRTWRNCLLFRSELSELFPKWCLGSETASMLCNPTTFQHILTMVQIDTKCTVLGSLDNQMLQLLQSLLLFCQARHGALLQLMCPTFHMQRMAMASTKLCQQNWWTWQTQMTSRVFIESQGFAADSLCSCLPKANFCDIDSRTRTCKDTRNVLNRYSKYMQIHANTCRHSYWHFCTRQVIFGSQLNASVEMRNGWDGSNHEAQAASFPAIGDKSSTLQTSNTKMLQTFGFRVKRFYPRQTNKVFSWRMLRVRTLGLCRFQRETALRSDCENKVSYILL